MTMAIEHYDQPQQLEDVLFIINQIFITIFTLECAMKIIALRQYYFRQPWNVFDFVVVISSILGKQERHLGGGLKGSTDPKDLWFYFFLVNCIFETVLLLQEQYVT